MHESNQLVDSLKKGDEKTIASIYNDNRNGFILFASRYEINKEDIIDIYQDAVIVLCENAKKGLLDNLQSNISTYLYSIGKYMIFHKLKKAEKNTIKKETIPDDLDWEFYEEEQENSEVQLLQKAWGKIGEQCKKVLQLFYYEEKKLDEIMEILAYTNKDVLKSQKSRCLKQLKDLTTSKDE
ncbi:RNA polymerase sigma factor [Flavobacterium terrae]|uniref:RNA polymerase sigma factor, sigma-70 family n=1 Tax=Flavobacterium terrae TaxID=415425 RepID=A0A1M6AZL4_9FLAO|nr:sigma-70 family RNA polymerase sigma factor [Flavobacterium terrae]SHI41877.1 RNA polymerase sigma factor, sigma-70 family [Flavobacterium terrae]